MIMIALIVRFYKSEPNFYKVLSVAGEVIDDGLGNVAVSGNCVGMARYRDSDAPFTCCRNLPQHSLMGCTAHGLHRTWVASYTG